MKKFFGLVLLVAILASAFPVSVSAAPANPVLVVTPPTEGVQGDEFVFTAMLTGLPKAKVTKVNYQIQIFKQAVDSVWIATANGQEVMIEELEDSYLITWTKAVKKNKSDKFAAFEVGVKLSSVNSGQMTLLQTVDGNNITVSLVNIKPATITWSVTAPSLVSVNTKFDIVLNAVNNSGVSLPFDIVTKINFLCSDRSVYAYEYPVQNSGGGGDSTGNYLRWSGEVPPRSTYTWKFQVGSGKISCIDTLFDVTNATDGSRILSHNFRVQ